MDRKLLDELATCRYLESATNILLVGPPGKARHTWRWGWPGPPCTPASRTYFTTAADLAARCHRAAIEGRWATTMRFYLLAPLGVTLAMLAHAFLVVTTAAKRCADTTTTLIALTVN